MGESGCCFPTPWKVQSGPTELEYLAATVCPTPRDGRISFFATFWRKNADALASKKVLPTYLLRTAHTTCQAIEKSPSKTEKQRLSGANPRDDKGEVALRLTSRLPVPTYTRRYQPRYERVTPYLTSLLRDKRMDELHGNASVANNQNNLRVHKPLIQVFHTLPRRRRVRVMQQIRACRWAR